MDHDFVEDESILLHLERAKDGDERSQYELFSRYRQRLRVMIRLRLNPRIRRRVDESDVIQEVYLDVARRFQEYSDQPRLSFYLWLRHITGLKLLEVHRRHMATENRDLRREIGFNHGAPDANSHSIVAQLLGNATSPSLVVRKDELKSKLNEALDSMDPIDREVLVLRHFEQLSTSETAALLNMSKAGAGSRYLRALKRLRKTLTGIAGFEEKAIVTRW